MNKDIENHAFVDKNSGMEFIPCSWEYIRECCNHNEYKSRGYRYLNILFNKESWATWLVYEPISRSIGPYQLSGFHQTCEFGRSRPSYSRFHSIALLTYDRFNRPVFIYVHKIIPSIAPKSFQHIINFSIGCPKSSLYSMEFSRALHVIGNAVVGGLVSATRTKKPKQQTESVATTKTRSNTAEYEAKRKAAMEQREARKKEKAEKLAEYNRKAAEYKLTNCDVYKCICYELLKVGFNLFYDVRLGWIFRSRANRYFRLVKFFGPESSYNMDNKELKSKISVNIDSHGLGFIYPRNMTLRGLCNHIKKQMSNEKVCKFLESSEYDKYAQSKYTRGEPFTGRFCLDYDDIKVVFTSIAHYKIHLTHDEEMQQNRERWLYEAPRNSTRIRRKVYRIL